MPWPPYLALAPLARGGPAQLRIAVPWVLAFLAWAVASRVAVTDQGFDASWSYWLLAGGVVIPAVVVGASLPLGVSPTAAAVAGSALAAELGTIVSVLALRASREPFPFAILGGFFVALLATGAYAVSTSRGEVARRDAESR